jgi:TolB protein
MKVILLTAFISIISLFLFITHADESKATETNILIKQLGDDDWETRESAQKELIKMGEGLIQEYHKLKQVASSEDGVASKPSPLATHYSLLKGFADALQEAGESNDAEIRMRVTRSVLPYLYRLTRPKIAYNSPNQPHQICIMDEDGGNQKQLTDNNSHNADVTWSPDGQQIAFMSECDGNQQIYIMEINGKILKKLTDDKFINRHPFWSPDGAKIVFASNRDGNYEIYIMDVDGKNQQRLTENEADDLSPFCNPDGTKIAFQSNRSGRWQVYIMPVSPAGGDADGKNAQRLTDDKTNDCGGEWSPDGKKILLTSTGEKPIDDQLSRRIYVIDVDGTNRKLLIDGQAESGRWSSDGKKIVFQSCRNPTSNSFVDVYVVDADGKNLQRLTTTGGYSPVWSPACTELSGLFEIKEDK